MTLGKACRRDLFVGVFLVALCASGCKTQNEGPEGSPASETDGLRLTEGARDKDAGTRIPVSLWSPQQRRSTAGFYFLAAEYMSLKDKDHKKALPVYEAAYGLDPNPFLGGKMLAAKAASGKREEALLEARKMVLLYPRDPRLRFFYGDMLTQGGRGEEAAEQLEKAIELDPKMEQAYLELIEVYHGKDVPKAIVVAKELTRHMPGSVVGWSVLSRLYLTTGNHKEALIPARRAWEMQSQNPTLTQIYAIVLQLNGKSKQAVRMYEQLYRMDPTDQETTARMVELYREIGNLDDAIALLDEMARQGGNGKPAVQMQKALLLWELKRFQDASDLLQKLAKDYPDSDRVKYLAAIGLERTEQWKEALAAYEAVPGNSNYRYHSDFRRVVILKQLKRYDEAAALGRQLVENQQADWDAWGMLSGVYADADRFKDAVEAADTGWKKFPARPRLLFLKGVYQEKAGDRDGCITTMRDVIAKDPTNSSAFNYLGYLFVEKSENLDEAEALIKKALELKPDDGFYLDSLGWLYYQKKEYDKAVATLEKALKIEPKEGVIMEHLGDVKKVKGDEKAARDLYEAALKTELEVRDRPRIEDKLKETLKDIKKAGG